MKDLVVIASIAPFPFRWKRTYGQYTLAACAEDRDYAVLEVRDARDHFDLGENVYRPYPIPADAIAEDLVGADEQRHGVFVCAGAKPTRAELAAAQERRHAYYQALIADGDLLWQRYHRYEHISDVHKRAAGFLGVQREWLSSVVENIDCPGCGETVKAKAAFCRFCGTVLNEQTYAALEFVDKTEEPAPARKGKPKETKEAVEA